MGARQDAVDPLLIVENVILRLRRQLLDGMPVAHPLGDPRQCLLDLTAVLGRDFVVIALLQGFFDLADLLGHRTLAVHLHSRLVRLGQCNARQAQQQHDHRGAVHRQPPDPSERRPNSTSVPARPQGTLGRGHRP
ncbi:hypothetical protein D3C73_1334420 [compost metagenome]